MKGEVVQMGPLKKILKHRKVLVIACIVLVLATAGFIIFRFRSLAAKAGSAFAEQRTAAAFRGELNVTLSGSGSVSPINRKEIVAMADGIVTESCLEEGRTYKKGDVLLKLDNTDALLNVKKLEISLKQKEMSALNAEISGDSLIVRAPFSGRVSELGVKEGTSVNKGDKLLTIVDDETLQARLVFENADISQFNSLHTLEVHIPDFMSSLPGKIVSAAQDGSDVMVTVSIDNPGALTSGLTVWAECTVPDGILSSGQGTLEPAGEEIIRAEAAGKVTDLSVYQNSKVDKGGILMHITDEALPYTIESERLSLEQARTELEQAKEKLENYTIRAPFDGVAVSVMDIDPGDMIEAGSKIAILMDTSEMTFDIAIDELDITSVEIGQKVIVTVEALDNEQIEGNVTAIAPEGQTSNGVTSYDVTITIPGSESLKSGMNVDAAILVVNRQDALLVPVEAIQKLGDGYIVWVKGTQARRTDTEQSNRMQGGRMGTRSQMNNNSDDRNTENLKDSQSRPDAGSNESFDSEQNRFRASQTRNRNIQGTANNYYSGATPVKVEVGAHNETYVEITEGLKEGDIVVLPPLASTSPNSTASEQGGQGFMIPGGMSGMPGGMSGFPGGMSGMPGGMNRMPGGMSGGFGGSNSRERRNIQQQGNIRRGN